MDWSGFPWGAGERITIAFSPSSRPPSTIHALRGSVCDSNIHSVHHPNRTKAHTTLANTDNNPQSMIIGTMPKTRTDTDIANDVPSEDGQSQLEEDKAEFLAPMSESNDKTTTRKFDRNLCFPLTARCK